ncbi:ATP-dependent DNA helicase PIF1 [Medicago truncatula]|uniref:ATP-dependent DNA helicase PIF1 n=1 Tax=Medicago truncatula TaxID=3880 RepID=UPI000D2F2BB4|nr:ATP-dependent DNA helicase PIF1 [Medicago truncatula]
MLPLPAAIRLRGEIVLIVASSGITALLIPGGRTAHSRFGLPFIIDEYSTCNVKPNTPLAQLVVQARLVIWDEAPMMHKFYFEALDRSFRDVRKEVDKRNKYIPFGGKVVVFGGDFRQILHVIPKGTRPEIVHATINSSKLWSYCEVLTLTKNMRLLFGASVLDIEAKRKFSEWVLSLGDGRIGEDNEVDNTIALPSDFLIESAGDPLAAIVESMYPNILESMSDICYFQNRAILTTKNFIVEKINDYMLDMVLGGEKVYLSYDSPIHRNLNDDHIDDVHTPEFLNTITAYGLPNHKLRLKVGVPVMLLRNIDTRYGLCNGTRLVITRMGRYVIEGRVISGSNVGDQVFVSRLSISPSNVRIPFKFQRRQFPLNVSFAMTINKSQG